uniref:UPF0725 protein n=1 Tax=Noccaea caerulescens TaxID=107243 RepID=A0A1J3G7A0_NOCCA
MTNDNWTDAECRYFFDLFEGEKKKGNKTKAGMNQTGKDFIAKKFEEKFGKKHIWNIFRNKYDTSRRIYARYKKLIYNRTGLGYDAMGRIDMSEDWWEQRKQEWPEAVNYKNKMLANMDVYDREFGAIVVTGAEGWSAQQGEASLDSRVGTENNDDEADSVDMQVPIEETQNRVGCSRPKRKRKEVDPATEISIARNVILEQKNKLVAHMVERDDRSSVENVLEVLNDLPGVRKWSPFHSGAVDHLLADLANRQGFMAFPSVEDKISYLEHITGRKLDD